MTGIGKTTSFNAELLEAAHAHGRKIAEQLLAPNAGPAVRLPGEALLFLAVHRAAVQTDGIDDARRLLRLALTDGEHPRHPDAFSQSWHRDERIRVGGLIAGIIEATQTITVPGLQQAAATPQAVAPIEAPVSTQQPLVES